MLSTETLSDETVNRTLNKIQNTAFKNRNEKKYWTTLETMDILESVQTAGPIH
jgi:hypothetical protein